MKAQVLVDFINELSPNSGDEELSKNDKEWTLSIDGSCNKKEAKCGQGVGWDVGKIYPTTCPSREERKGKLASKGGKYAEERA
ncbi:hypothetical protein CR513_34937, partial [Mucuna pruriens]